MTSYFFSEVYEQPSDDSGGGKGIIGILYCGHLISSPIRQFRFFLILGFSYMHKMPTRKFLWVKTISHNIIIRILLLLFGLCN